MIATDSIATAAAALLEDGFVNASVANLGGNVEGVVIPWDEQVVVVTEDGGFFVGIYSTEQWDNGEEPVELYEVQTTAEVVKAVNGALGIDD